jgi:hypothetical protein
MPDDAAAPVPSVAELTELTELTEAATRFCIQWRRSEGRTWEEEDRLLIASVLVRADMRTSLQDMGAELRPRKDQRRRAGKSW